MSVYAIYLTIESLDAASTTYRTLKQFDPSLELGPVLQKIKSRQHVIVRENISRQTLEKIVLLLDQLEVAGVDHSVSVSPVPIHCNRDGTKTQMTSRIELKAEIRQRAEIERRTLAFQTFCKERGYKDGHWILVEREEEFETAIERVGIRSQSLDLDNLLSEEVNYLYVEEFESLLLRGGFGTYLADAAGDSVSEVEAALQELGSVEVLQILHEAIRLIDPFGGYSAQSKIRVANLSLCSIDLFDEVNTRFHERSEDIVSIALSELEAAYESLDA